jgi:hypothetical protein
MIHATQFLETALSTLAGFLECGNGSDLRMGASTLVRAVPKVDAPIPNGVLQTDP